jgi:WASH complex subunit 7
MPMSEWCTKINSFTLSDLPGITKASEDLNSIFKTIMSGLSIASQIKTLTDDILLLHYTEQVNLHQPLLLPIIKAIAMLKGIDFEINAKITQISLLVPLIRRVIQNQLQVVWEDTLNSIEKQERSEWREFLKYSFTTALTTTKLELNNTHIKFLLLLKPILCSKELIKQKLYDPLLKYYEQLLILENLQKNQYNATHIVYFYKIRSYSFLFFEILSQSGANIYLLKYLLRAFEDSKRLLNCVAYLEEQDLLIKEYKAELLNTFHDTIVSSLVEAIEKSLRERVEEYYKKSKVEDNPMSSHEIDIKYFLKCEPLFLFGERISIKSIIEQRLTKRFYELTASDVQNWQLCEDMKCIAYNLYSLTIQDNLLLPKKLQQGLDIISIIKRLQYFVLNYHYSLHTQVFFERISKGSIDVFGVTQAVNSFNIHGMGIRNTALSAIYKLVGR